MRRMNPITVKKEDIVDLEASIFLPEWEEGKADIADDVRILAHLIRHGAPTHLGLRKEMSRR
jgi:hypothetical protein